MYYSKEDLIGVSDKDIEGRMSLLADECNDLEDELRMANNEWELLSEVKAEREEAEALVEYVNLSRDDIKEGKVISSESFKDKLNKRKLDYGVRIGEGDVGFKVVKGELMYSTEVKFKGGVE
jgi:hypothetical protein